MGPTYDDREPEPTAPREPLVDIQVELPPPNESQAGAPPRRKRLSDIETSDGGTPPPPRAKTQYRRSLATPQIDPNEPHSDSNAPPQPRRPRLVDITEAPQEPQLRPRGGRPRVGVTQPAEDTPGLRNIIDPPQALSHVPAPSPSGIEQTAAERQAKQSFSFALVAGLTAAVVAAIVWALTTMTTGYHVGWMAIGVGLLIGGAVRTMGRGVDKSFGYLGAALSVSSCLLGNLLSVCATVAGQEGLSPANVLVHVCSKPALIPAATIAAFQPLDLLFCGIAVYAGYRLSFRRASNAENSGGPCRN